MPLLPAEYISELIDGRIPAEPQPAIPPWNELAQILRSAAQSDRPQTLQQWVRNANADGDIVMEALVNIQSQNPEQPIQNLGRLWNLGELVREDLGQLPVLVGSQSNALFVRGEGHFVVGPAGVGKTILALNMALKMAHGENVLGFNTNTNLNILIIQAELPLQFLRHRLNCMLEGYRCTWGRPDDCIERRIHILGLDSPIDLSKAENRQYILRTAQSVSADIIIIDPFLPFFRGEENSNTEVRTLLDAIKYEIAGPCNCALIITDHISKSDPGGGARARGASAKIDWAASVINLAHQKAPEGHEGKFISATITKMRYGWNDERPIMLRLDPETLIYSGLNPDSDTSMEAIRQIIMDAGGEISPQGRMLTMIRNRLGLGPRPARRILHDAINTGIIEVVSGRNRAAIYRLVNRHGERNEDNVENLI